MVKITDSNAFKCAKLPFKDGHLVSEESDKNFLQWKEFDLVPYLGKCDDSSKPRFSCVPMNSHLMIKSRKTGTNEMEFYTALLQVDFKNKSIIIDLDESAY